MTLYRANDRLPEDETILLVKDPEEFKLFRERGNLGIRGIVYDVAVSDTLRNSLIEFAKIVLAKYKNDPQSLSALMTKQRYDKVRFIKDTSPPTDLEIRMDVDTPQVVFEKTFKEYASPKDFKGITELYNTLALLKTCRTNAVNPDYTKQMWLKINSFYPRHYHRHEPFLTMSFNQPGTEFKNADETKSIVTPINRALIIDMAVHHRASQISDSDQKDSPRIGCML